MTLAMKTTRQPASASATNPFRSIVKQKKQYQSVEVNSLLQSEIAHLWPAIANINALQKECVAALPQLFLYCQVLHYEEHQLILAAPNAALATKLKQQLPKLQTSLQKTGWQINAIRIKVQENQSLQNETLEKQCHMTDSALSAFGSLEKNLSKSKHNEELLGALRNLLQRHKK